MRAKLHTVALKLQFDKPVTKTQAVDAAKNAIHGDFYPNPHECGADLMKVKAITRIGFDRRNGEARTKNVG